MRTDEGVCPYSVALSLIKETPLSKQRRRSVDTKRAFPCNEKGVSSHWRTALFVCNQYCLLPSPFGEGAGVRLHLCLTKASLCFCSFALCERNSASLHTARPSFVKENTHTNIDKKAHYKEKRSPFINVYIMLFTNNKVFIFFIINTPLFFTSTLPLICSAFFSICPNMSQSPRQGSHFKIKVKVWGVEASFLRKCIGIQKKNTTFVSSFFSG